MTVSAWAETHSQLRSTWTEIHSLRNRHKPPPPPLTHMSAAWKGRAITAEKAVASTSEAQS